MFSNQARFSSNGCKLCTKLTPIRSNDSNKSPNGSGKCSNGSGKCSNGSMNYQNQSVRRWFRLRCRPHPPNEGLRDVNLNAKLPGVHGDAILAPMFILHEAQCANRRCRVRSQA